MKVFSTAILVHVPEKFSIVDENLEIFLYLKNEYFIQVENEIPKAAPEAGDQNELAPNTENVDTEHVDATSEQKSGISEALDAVNWQKKVDDVTAWDIDVSDVTVQRKMKKPGNMHITITVKCLIFVGV